MLIRVLSFDFDGCLFNYRYIHDKRTIINANKPFFDDLKKRNESFDEVVVCIGSNRQSYNIDKLGSKQNHTKSCFQEIRHVSDYLRHSDSMQNKVQFDSFLLADIFAAQQERREWYDGKAYDCAYNEVLGITSYNDSHPRSYYDTTKVLIVYAQIHRMAHRFKDGNEITFDFYDNEGNILSALYKFFNNNPQFIPNNVTLRLHQYGGQHVVDWERPIRGEGEIDEGYRNTVHKMFTLSRPNDAKTLSINAATSVTELYLRVHPSKFNLTQETLLDELNNKVCYFRNMHSPKYERARNTSRTLYTKLIASLNKESKDDQIAAAKQAIDKARPVLEEHRGMKQILVNLLCVFILLMPQVVHYFRTNRNHFFFHPDTDSARSLDAVKEAFCLSVQA